MVERMLKILLADARLRENLVDIRLTRGASMGVVVRGVEVVCLHRCFPLVDVPHIARLSVEKVVWVSTVGWNQEVRTSVKTVLTLGGKTGSPPSTDHFLA